MSRQRVQRAVHNGQSAWDPSTPTPLLAIGPATSRVGGKIGGDLYDPISSVSFSPNWLEVWNG